MKKLYTTIILLSLTSLFSAKAQCTPDESIKATGIFYDKEVPFCLNQPYSQTFQLAVTNDTTLIVFGQTINTSVDSVEVISIANIPDGITYNCLKPNCKMINSGGSHSHTCMVVSGTPTASGDYNLVFKFRLYGSGAFIDQEIDVPITVESNCVPTAITPDISSRKNISIYPQPAKTNANLEVLLNTSSNVTVTIHNLLGQPINTAFTGSLNTGLNKINISEYINTLESGLYMITTEINNSNKSESYTKRLVID